MNTEKQILADLKELHDAIKRDRQIVEKRFAEWQKDLEQNRLEWQKDLEKNRLEWQKDLEKNRFITEAKFAHIDGYEKKEADGIEIEATLAVKLYLSTHHMFYGLKLYLPNGFPKKLYDPFNNSILTDLDGVYILTNDPSADDLNDEVIAPARQPGILAEGERQRAQMARSLRVATTSANSGNTNTIKTQPPIVYQMVIIEAKHYMSAERIDNKITQLQAIEQYIACAVKSKTDPLNFSKKFVKNVKAFNFDLYNPVVKLYLASPYWDAFAMKKIRDTLNAKPDMGDRIGIVKPNGSRYGVADVNSLFRMIGGAKKGGKPKKNFELFRGTYILK